MEEPNIKIYVAMHKPDNYVLILKDNPIYVPIHCGKAIYDASKYPEVKNQYLPKLGDDTGDNISIWNPHYSELTAMYWIWKNDKSKPDDIVGLNHYRRYFSERNDNLKLLTKETIFSELKNTEFILNGCGTEHDYVDDPNNEFTIYNGYKSVHIIKDLDNALTAIRNQFPLLFTEIERQIKHGSAMCLCNMLITTKKFFDEYCSFLFPVLFEVASKIDFKNDEEHKGYNGRVFGFLGERLLRPWLMATNHQGIALPGLDWEKYSGYTWS